MKCPRCGSTESQRYRSPVERNEVVLRRHRCSNCGLVFLSAQVVVDPELEQELLDVFES
jgi:transcriptional regulator NrdR family protein